MCTAASGLCTRAASSVLRIWKGTTDGARASCVSPWKGTPWRHAFGGLGLALQGQSLPTSGDSDRKGQAGDAVPFARNLTHWQLSSIADARVHLSGRGVNSMVRLQLQCKKRLLNLWCRIKCQRHQVSSCRGFALTLEEKG